jgi:hypothetical protein
MKKERNELYSRNERYGKRHSSIPMQCHTEKLNQASNCLPPFSSETSEELFTILLFVTPSLLRRHNTIRYLVSNKSSSVTFRNNGLSKYPLPGNERLC